MQNVQIPCLGGVKFGYVHQDEKDENLYKKVETLSSEGCGCVFMDIGKGNRQNFDLLLERVTLRDLILFYNTSVFQTYHELFDIFDLAIASIGQYGGKDGFSVEFYDDDRDKLGHTVEVTDWLRAGCPSDVSVMKYLT